MLVPGATLVTLSLTMGLSLVTVRGGALRYDQAQTGDTNIHLQIKNVEVVALLDDSIASDYEYDYNDFTEPGPGKPGANDTVGLKPPPPPVAAPAPVEAGNATATTAANSTQSNSPEEPLLGPTTTTATTTTAAATSSEESSTASSVASKKSRRCGAGFYRDNSGRCRRIRRPHLQMMMSLGRTKTTESPAA